MKGTGLLLAVACLLAGCGSADATLPNDTCHEGLTAKDCKRLEAIVLPAALPAARGNDHAEDFNAAVFGFHVFFDSRFSKNVNVRCESCHSVDYGFADNSPTSTEGLEPGVRNAPTIFNAARYSTFFWDGRADVLWSQPLFALENPKEMDFTRLEIVHLLNAIYTREYGDAFGALPDFSDLTRFPARGAPGDPAFDGMSADDQKSVNAVVANMGKALEAYMRKIAAGPSPVDRYLSRLISGAAAPPAPAVDAGYKSKTVSTLTAAEERGFVVFATSGCLDCHSGSQLSDNEFHNLGVPAASGETPDPGHSDAAIQTLENNPFNSAGPFFDGTPEELPAQTPVLGGFRTPSLRNLRSSAPYGHNGSFATLEDIVDFHLQGGGKDTTTFVGEVDPLLKPRHLSNEDRAALVEFLKVLQGDYPALPWGQWPSGNG